MAPLPERPGLLKPQAVQVDPKERKVQPPETSAPGTSPAKVRRPGAEPPVEFTPTAAPDRPAKGTVPSQRAAQPEPSRLPAPSCASRPGAAPEMVLVEAGVFQMGSPADEPGRSGYEGPRHKVTIVRPYALGRCEVTVGEFALFVAETGYVTDSERALPNKDRGCYTWDVNKQEGVIVPENYWRFPGFPQADDHPVVCVSWRDASRYAEWLSLRTAQRYRLPTEAEWEYAARGGTSTARYWDGQRRPACDFANGLDETAKAMFPDFTALDCSDGAAYTAAVAGYRANAFGLHDVMGNVWEWTQDCWHGGYEGAPANGSAWEKGAGGDCGRRVVRGGGWSINAVNLRSAYRNGLTTDGANFNLGFRLARDL